MINESSDSGVKSKSLEHSRSKTSVGNSAKSFNGNMEGDSTEEYFAHGSDTSEDNNLLSPKQTSSKQNAGIINEMEQFGSHEVRSKQLKNNRETSIIANMAQTSGSDFAVGTGNKSTKFKDSEFKRFGTGTLDLDVATTSAANPLAEEYNSDLSNDSLVVPANRSDSRIDSPVIAAQESDSDSSIGSPVAPAKWKSFSSELPDMDANVSRKNSAPKVTINQQAPKPKKTKIVNPKKLPKPPTLTNAKLVKDLFKHYCPMRVTKEALADVCEKVESFVPKLIEDLSIIAEDFGRDTIKISDVVHHMQSQDILNDKVHLEALLHEHLPLEDVEKIIPRATANNVLKP